jgi:hypothetical protein
MLACRLFVLTKALHRRSGIPYQHNCPIKEPTAPRGDCLRAEILPRRRIAPWLTKKWVGSSKAVNRAVSRNRVSKLSNQDAKAGNKAASKAVAVSRSRVNKIRCPDVKAASKAVAVNKADNKAVSRAHKIVRLCFAPSQKKSPGVSPGDFCCAEKSGPGSEPDTGPPHSSFQPVKQG